MKRPIYLIILLLLQVSITAQALNKENNDTLNRQVAIAIKNKKINISKFAPANKNCALGLYYLAEKRDTARAIPLLREAAHLGNNYSRGVLVNYYSHASKNYFLAYYYYCDSKWELAVGIINLLLIITSVVYLLLQVPDFIINKLWKKENRLQRGLEDGDAKCQFEKAKQIFYQINTDGDEKNNEQFLELITLLDKANAQGYPKDLEWTKEYEDLFKDIADGTQSPCEENIRKRFEEFFNKYYC